MKPKISLINVRGIQNRSHPSGRQILLSLLVLSALVLSACTPSAGVFDVQIIPAAAAKGDQSALDEVRPLAVALLSGLPEDRRPFVQFLTTTCTTADGLGGPPKCQFGEPDGSPVRVFPLGGVEASYLRPEEINRMLDFGVNKLYAVYRTDPNSRPEPFWPASEVALLFEREEKDNPVPITAFVQDGNLVRLDITPGVTPEQILNGIPVEQVILPPGQAQAWSAPLEGMSVGSQPMTSPDKQWTTNTMIALPRETSGEYYQRMSVTSQDDQTTWLVVDEWAPFGAEYTAPFPLAWSRKEQALFWTYTPTPGGCVVFSNASDLHKLDLRTGASSQLLGPVGQWLALSPDEGRVASVGPGELAVYELATGVKQTVTLPEGQAGQIVWSPDGRALALTVDNDPCGDPANASTSILRVDTQSMTATALIERDPRRFSTQAWSLLGSVTLADKDGVTWQMDPQTGQVWNESNPRPTEAASAQAAVIHFYAPVQPEDASPLQRLAEEFNRERPEYQVVFTDPPADIDYLHFDADQYLVSLARQNDCFIEYDPGSYKNQADLLLDLNPLAQAEGPEFLQDFYPDQLNTHRLEGRLIGMPLLMRPHVMSYNADLLSSQGLEPPSPDWTFGDFLHLAEAASSSAPGNPVYGFAGDDSDLLWLVEGLGGKPFNLDSNPPQANFSTPEMTQALARMAELRKSGMLLLLKPSLYADADAYAVSDAWFEGRVAFWPSIAGLYQLVSIGHEELPPYQIGILPLPQLPAGSTQMPVYDLHITVESFFIIGDSPNVQACWAWYRYLADSGAFLSVPARRSIAASPAWEVTVGQERAQMLKLAVEKIFQDGKPRHRDAISPLTHWLFLAVRAYLDGADLTGSLAEAQRKADAYLACLKPAVTSPISQEDLWQVISTCSRQVDPEAGW